MSSLLDGDDAGLDVTIREASPEAAAPIPEKEDPRQPGFEEPAVPEIPEEIRMLLKTAVREISTLRAEVNYLTPKAQAYDVIQKMLFGIPSEQGRGYSVDVVWHIEQALNAAQPVGVAGRADETVDQTRPA